MLKKSLRSKSAIGAMVVAIYLCVTVGHSTPVHSKRQPPVNSITADFRITKADGTKSLTQLMAEQNPQVIPQNRKLASLYFIVSAEGDNLILNGSSTSPGFQMVIARGDDKLFPLSPLPFDADELLAGATARTNGTCDFFVHVELAPDDDRR